jgi:hypothetical protein
MNLEQNYQEIIKGVLEKIGHTLVEASNKFSNIDDKVIKAATLKYRDNIDALANDIVVLSDTIAKIDLLKDVKIKTAGENSDEVKKIEQERDKYLYYLAILDKVATELEEYKIVSNDDIIKKISNIVTTNITGFDPSQANELIKMLEVKYHISLSSGVNYILSLVSLARSLGKDADCFIPVLEVFAKDVALIAYKEGAYDTFAFTFGVATTLGALIYDMGLTYISTRADAEISEIGKQFVQMFASVPDTETSKHLNSINQSIQS